MLDRVKRENRGGEKRYLVNTPNQLEDNVRATILFKELIYDVKARFMIMEGYDVKFFTGFDVFPPSIDKGVLLDMNIEWGRDISTADMRNFFSRCQSLAEDIIRDAKEIFDPLSLINDDFFKTSELAFIDSAWWTTHQLFNKGLLDKNTKEIPWCISCRSFISEMEIKKVPKDSERNLLKLPLSKGNKRYLLIELTDLWDLIGVVALAVETESEYCIVAVRTEDGYEKHVLRGDKVDEIMGLMGDVEYKIMNRFPGKKFRDIEYVNPLSELIPYLKELPHETKVIAVDELPDTSTGIFNVSPCLDSTSKNLANKFKLSKYSPFGPEGNLEDEKALGDFRGIPLEIAEEKIFDVLSKKGFYMLSGGGEATNDSCMHCGGEVVRKESEEWFFLADSLEEEMRRHQDLIQIIPPWMGGPKHHDWIGKRMNFPITRRDGWGIPFPLWTCDCGKMFIPESITELSRYSGVMIREKDKLSTINRMKLTCDSCGGFMEKEQKVLNTLFLSSISPWAQLGYPDKKRKLDSWIPGDCLFAPVDHNYGSLYGAYSISSCLFENPIVSTFIGYGKVLLGGSENIKISPKFGADSFRLEMLSDRLLWDDVEISIDMFTSPSTLIRVLWNLYEFTKTSMEQFLFDPNDVTFESLKGHLRPEDRWLLGRLEILKIECMDDYLESRFDSLLDDIDRFILDNLTQFYFSLGRKRLVDSAEKDTLAVLKVFHETLTVISKILYPVCPHVCEEIYLELGGSKKSVLLTKWPDENRLLADWKIDDKIKQVKWIIEQVYQAKRENDMPEKWPLKRLIFHAKRPSVIKLVEEYEHIIKDKCRVDYIDTVPPEEEWEEMILKVHPNHNAIGRAYRQWVSRIALMLEKRPAKELKKVTARDRPGFLSHKRFLHCCHGASGFHSSAGTTFLLLAE